QLRKPKSVEQFAGSTDRSVESASKVPDAGPEEGWSESQRHPAQIAEGMGSGLAGESAELPAGHQDAHVLALCKQKRSFRSQSRQRRGGSNQGHHCLPLAG